MKIYLSLIVFFFLSCEGRKDKDGILTDDEHDIYTKFLKDNKKSCGDQSSNCKTRKGNFANNLKKYNAIKKSANFKTKMHPDMDWSAEELRGRLINKDLIASYRKNHADKRNRIPKKFRTKRSIPDFYDWRSTGAVNDVKWQGKCGDCWAFAATAVVEILDNLVNCHLDNDTRLSFSEQLVTDCTYYDPSLPQAQQRNGCDGGWGWNALDYIIKSGITTEASVPFLGAQGVCQTSPNPNIKPIRDQMVLTNDVQGMLNYIATTAPISVGVYVCDDFYHASGIYDNADCNESNSEGGHALAVIGYGTENGVDYWLCRNSWGTGYGEDGYYKIKRGADIISIESQGVFAPIPTVGASECTTNYDYPYSDCDCTPPSNLAPKAPFNVQRVSGESGCIPSNWLLNCEGSGTEAFKLSLYDDNGNVIESSVYCHSWSDYIWMGKCQTSSPGGFTNNYPTWNGSRVAYRVCESYGPQSWCA